MDSEHLLRNVASVLERLNIPYLMTGGMAVVVWGRPRFTADIDLVIQLMPDRIDDLVSALQAIDQSIHLDREAVEEAVIQQGEFNLLHPGSGLKVDFWILKKDPYSQEQLRRRVKRFLGKTPIYVASPEDLVLAKLLWYRDSQSTRQLEDIQSILGIQADLDIRYIESWSQRHGTFEIWQSLRKPPPAPRSVASRRE